jgi:hypothetical protein
MLADEVVLEKAGGRSGRSAMYLFVLAVSKDETYEFRALTEDDADRWVQGINEWRDYLLLGCATVERVGGAGGGRGGRGGKGGADSHRL